MKASELAALGREDHSRAANETRSAVGRAINDARLVLLKTEQPGLFETASELSARQKLNAIRAGLADVIARLDRLVPPFAVELGNKDDVKALYEIELSLQKLLLVGGAS